MKHYKSVALPNLNMKRYKSNFQNVKSPFAN